MNFITGLNCIAIITILLGMIKLAERVEKLEDKNKEDL